jgi:uncharacterized protein YbbC (DUF1343 family)
MKSAVILTIFYFFINFNISCQEPQPTIKLGIDRIIENDFELFQGLRIALFTNYTGRTSTGKLTAEAFKEAKNCTLTAIFTPEHGFYANISAGEHVADDSLFEVPVYSLYGNNRKPTTAQLSDCDAIVVDFQDIGIRSYTYISSMVNIMETASRQNLPVYILDRPNPLGGLTVDGLVAEKEKLSFVSIAPIGYIHGMTIGELARMINEEEWLTDSSKNPASCNLTIIKMTGWERSMQWEDTRLMWLPTSPNIPSVDAIRGAAMVGLYGELGTIGIGIGTSSPFQYIGNQNFNTEDVLNELGSDCFDGVKLIPAKFKNSNIKNNAKTYSGFLLRFLPDTNFAPLTTATKIMLAIKKIHPEYFSKSSIGEQNKKMFAKVAGSDELLNAILKNATDEYILKIIRKGLDGFIKLRSKYLMY